MAKILLKGITLNGEVTDILVLGNRIAKIGEDILPDINLSVRRKVSIRNCREEEWTRI